MKLEALRGQRLAILAVEFLATLLIGFTPELVGAKWTAFEQAMLALGSFLVFLTADVLLLLWRMETIQIGEWRTWQIRDTADLELANIRTSFSEVVKESYGANDLFVAHLLKEMRNLGQKARDVAEKQELRVIADHFLSVENVLDAFEGDSDRTWRYIWHIGSEPLFGDEDLPWRRYFEGTAKMAREGKLASIKAILMVDDPEVLELPRVSKLLDFFHTNDRLDCRIVTRDVYQQACSSDGLTADGIDFGIYGTRLVFITKQYEPHVEGTFTKDASNISAHRSLFETMWNSESMTRANPSTATQRVTLAELLTFDPDLPLVK